MAVAKCDSCGKLVDLDTDVEGIIYMEKTPICDSCFSNEFFFEEYIDKLKQKIAELKRKLRKD